MNIDIHCWAIGVRRLFWSPSSLSFINIFVFLHLLFFFKIEDQISSTATHKKYKLCIKKLHIFALWKMKTLKEALLEFNFRFAVIYHLLTRPCAIAVFEIININTCSIASSKMVKYGFETMWRNCQFIS
jgi:hypothetical protein